MKKLFLSAAFVGFAFAASAQTAPTPPPPAHHPEMKENMQKRWEMMKQELQLTPQQEQQIKALRTEFKEANKGNREAMKAAMDRNRADVKANREKMDAAMRNILTPAQIQKWETMRKRPEGINGGPRKPGARPLPPPPAR